MPWGLERYHQSGQTHFVTFSCSHRQPGFLTAEAKRTFEIAVERVRFSYALIHLRLRSHAQKHVHLLLSEPQHETLAHALKSLKQGVARRLVESGVHFWQKRYYDFNVRNRRQFVEKLRYIHRNPVERGICETPEAWEWKQFSSLRDWQRRNSGNRIGVDCKKLANEPLEGSVRFCP